MTAPLERFTAGLCESMGLVKPGRTIALLERRGLLVRAEVSDDGWVELHGLVRDFARKHWPLARHELTRMLSRSGAWLETHGYRGDALRHFTAAKDVDSIVRMLSRETVRRFRAVSSAEVLAAGALLPPERREPAIEELLGWAHYALGDMTSAMDCYMRARDVDCRLSPRLAILMGLVHYPHGDLHEAIHLYQAARFSDPPGADEALVLAFWSNAHSLLGETEQAREVANRAVDAASASGDAEALAHAYHALGLAAGMAGDRRAAAAHYRRELQVAVPAGDALQITRAHNNLAEGLLEDGQCGEALAEVEAGLPVAEREGIVDLVPMMLSNRGRALLGLGQLEAAVSDFRSALALFESRNSDFAAEALAGLGDVYRERGDLTVARANYERAVTLAERTGNVRQLRPALAGLARTLVGDDPEEAARTAGRAVALGHGSEYPLALMAFGWVALALNKRRDAREASYEAAELARAEDNRALLAESLELGALSASEPDGETDSLLEAAAIWRELENPIGAARAELAAARLQQGSEAHGAADRARRRLEAVGVRVNGAAAGLLAAVPTGNETAVAIRTLGGFQLLREGTPLQLSQWRSKKARDLLKLLLARRGRPAPRELLMESLWPGQDPVELAGRFSVLLSTLRSLFDPGKRFDQQHYLAADKESVGLKLERLAVDVESFLSEAEAGLRAASEGRWHEAEERLEFAESIYTGDFLDEDRYQDWTVPLREEARATYVKVARELAERSLERGDYDGAARYLLRLLERDPHDESAHLRLVSTLLAARRHGDARRRYRTYVERMRELELEPAPFPAPTVV